MTRIERIVKEYFEPYNRTIENRDLDYVMEFLKVAIKHKKFIRTVLSLQEK